MSTTNIIGRKITGFRFKTMGDILWHEAMEDYIGQIGKILFRHDAVNTVLVLFPNGRLCRYPLSLIEQHLVPEEKSNNMNNTTDSQSDQVTKSSFNTRSPGFHCSVIGFPGVHKATFYGWDSNECQQRAQDFVNAEAYRVENERLRTALKSAHQHLCWSTMEGQVDHVQIAKNLIQSALSQNT